MPGRDFTKKREPVWFTVGDDHYDCYPNLIADDLRLLGNAIRGDITGDNAIEKIEEVFSIVMTPESYTLYQKRRHDREHAFDLEQLRDITIWLVEQYTKRPTVSPSDSTTGSPNGDNGSASTAGAPVKALNQASSTQNGF